MITKNNSTTLNGSDNSCTQLYLNSTSATNSKDDPQGPQDTHDLDVPHIENVPPTPTPAHTNGHVNDGMNPKNLIEQIKEIGQKPQKNRPSLLNELANQIGHLSARYDIELVPILVDSIRMKVGDAKKFLVDCRKEIRTAKKAKTQANLNPGVPTILINDRQFRHITSDIHDAVIGLNNQAHPQVFVRGGCLHWIVEDESGTVRSQPLSDNAMTDILSHAANWVRIIYDREGNAISQDAEPHRRATSTYLAKRKWSGIPALSGVVSAPTFSDSGTLHSEYGYNPDTRLFYSDSFELEQMTLEQAKGLILDDLLHDFPFENAASKAHTVALLLQPFIRPMISGSTPLYLVDAPTPGTGKGLLVTACSMPYIGYEPSSTAAGKDDDEWRKRLTSALLLGSSHISIDNITEPLDSGVLASYLTQPFIDDRILGSNNIVRLNIRNTWIANGNNVIPSDEVARRCVWIRLNANAEKPWDRTGFKHKELIVWVKENRERLVSAAITLVQHWIDEGMPSFTGKLKGSYERWTQTMGGILQSAGINGFLENSDELYETVASGNEVWTEFVKIWAGRYGQMETLATDLFKLASYNDERSTDPEYHDLLGDLLGSGKQRSRQTRLGTLLKNMRGATIAGYKIEKSTLSGGRARWQLKSINGGGPGGPSRPLQPNTKLKEKDKNNSFDSKLELGTKGPPRPPGPPQTNDGPDTQQEEPKRKEEREQPSLLFSQANANGQESS